MSNESPPLMGKILWSFQVLNYILFYGNSGSLPFVLAIMEIRYCGVRVGLWLLGHPRGQGLVLGEKNKNLVIHGHLGNFPFSQALIF